MSTVVVDAAFREKLLAVGSGAELRDESGQLLGRFVAASPAELYEIEGPEVSDEELDRREREDPSFTADQVMERLRELRRCL